MEGSPGEGEIEEISTVDWEAGNGWGWQQEGSDGESMGGNAGRNDRIGGILWVQGGGDLAQWKLRRIDKSNPNKDS